MFELFSFALLLDTYGNYTSYGTITVCEKVQVEVSRLMNDHLQLKLWEFSIGSAGLFGPVESIGLWINLQTLDDLKVLS